MRLYTWYCMKYELPLYSLARDHEMATVVTPSYEVVCSLKLYADQIIITETRLWIP